MCQIFPTWGVTSRGNELKWQSWMARRVYCTYFDHNYLSRGLALYRSLQRYAPGSKLWVLCLSDACLQALTDLALPDVIPVSLQEFEASDPEVAATRSRRKTVEYFFTCTPAWTRYVLEREKPGEWVTYLDGDLFFYSSPEAIYSELEDASVAIIPHRYPARLQRLRKFGIYNVGWVGVRNDAAGNSTVRWWREKCIEWCHDCVDNGRFADQGYLDHFQSRFERVKIIENVGANLAPWNVGGYRITYDGNQVVIDREHPLVFFHFQGLRRGLRWFIFNSHRSYHAPFSTVIKSRIYQPYVAELLAIEKQIAPLLNGVRAKPYHRSTKVDAWQQIKTGIRGVVSVAIQLLDVATGRAFLVIEKNLHPPSGSPLGNLNPQHGDR